MAGDRGDDGDDGQGQALGDEQQACEQGKGAVTTAVLRDQQQAGAEEEPGGQEDDQGAQGSRLILQVPRGEGRRDGSQPGQPRNGLPDPRPSPDRRDHRHRLPHDWQPARTRLEGTGD